VRIGNRAFSVDEKNKFLYQFNKYTLLKQMKSRSTCMIQMFIKISSESIIWELNLPKIELKYQVQNMEKRKT